MSFNILKFIDISKLLKQRKWQEKIAGTLEGAIIKKMGKSYLCKVTKGEDFEITMLAINEHNVREGWRVLPSDFFNIGLPFDASKMFSGIFAEFGKSDLSSYVLFLENKEAFENTKGEGIFVQCFEGESIVFEGGIFDLVCSFIEKNSEGIGDTFNQVSPTLPDVSDN